MRSVGHVMAAPSELFSKALAPQGTKRSSLAGIRKTRRTALLAVTALLASTCAFLAASAAPASATAVGTLSIFAGTGTFDVPTAGPATSSPLAYPERMAADSAGNLFIADPNNHVVEKVTPAGTLSIVAGTGTFDVPTPGPATSSALAEPVGVAVDSAGNLFIADDVSCVISKVTTTGQLSIVAGNGNCNDPTPGPATSSDLSFPNDVAVDSAGNLFIGGYEATVEKVTPDGTLSIFAGNGSFGFPTPGPATSSPMRYPQGMAVDSAGNLFIASDSNVILKVTPAGTLSIVAGTGTYGAPTPGPATSSDLWFPNDVAVDSAGNLFIADTGNNVVEKVTPEGTLSIVAGTGTGGAPTPGPATSSELSSPYGVAVDSSGNLFIADMGNSVVEKVTLAAPLPHAITDTIDIQRMPQGLAVSPDGTRLYATVELREDPGELRVINMATSTVLRSITVGHFPIGVVVSPNGSRVYVANRDDGTVSVINTSTNRVIKTITVGSGPRNLVMNASGTRLYVANTGSGNISVINTATNAVTSTITGFDGVSSVTLSPDGTRLYATNGKYHGGSLYIVATATGTITDTISVGAVPFGLAVTPDGGRIYVTHQDRNWLTEVNTVTKSVTKNITVGWNATSVAVSADGNRVYAPNADEGNMSVIDTTDDTVIETVATGPDATKLAVSPDGRRIYVGNPQTNSVLVFSELAPSAPTALVATAGDGSASIEFTPGDAASISKYQFSIDGGATWADADAGTSSPVTVHGLVNGSTYALKLRSVSGSEFGGASPSAAVALPFRAPVVASPSVGATPHRILVSWALLEPNRTAARVRSYRARAYLKGSSTILRSCVARSPMTSCTILGLDQGVAYDVSVFAVLVTGSGAGRQVFGSPDSAAQSITLP